MALWHDNLGHGRLSTSFNFIETKEIYKICIIYVLKFNLNLDLHGMSPGPSS